MRFIEGDIVRIRKTSRWNDGQRHNPFGVKGKIRDVSENNDIQVVWDNEQFAYYEECDLGLVRRSQNE